MKDSKKLNSVELEKNRDQNCLHQQKDKHSPFHTDTKGMYTHGSFVIKLNHNIKCKVYYHALEENQVMTFRNTIHDF